MTKKAGEIMAVFLKKYIKPPLDEMELVHQRTPLNLCLHWSDNCISIGTETNQYKIQRI
jgi:hypothetical protein